MSYPQTSSAPMMHAAEVRTLAERFVTSFVSLSEQAEQLKEVTEHVRVLTERVNQFETENAALRNEIHTLVAERDKARAEANEWATLANTYERERNEARNEVENLDNRVRSLSDQNDRQYQMLDDSTRLVRELQGKLAEAQASVDKAVAEVKELADCHASERSSLERSFGQEIETLRRDIAHHEDNAARGWNVVRELNQKLVDIRNLAA